ncbi:MAG: hypothetical protein LZF60_50076 [Nitrospira sp.]|nr:MAG: hypothetical protein LZF60_50076 [Nitrospira sp.]
MAWNEEAQIRCRFACICPQLWNRLEPTEKDDVRHCSPCNRDVYLASSEADVRRHSEQGHCIAVPVAGADGEADPEEPCWLVGKTMPPYGTK